MQSGHDLDGSGRWQTPSLTVAALIVAAGFLGSRLLGLLRSVIIAEAFGTQPELDAYWVAFRLPDLVFQLLAGATLASAFIPTFAGVRAARRRGRGLAAGQLRAQPRPARDRSSSPSSRSCWRRSWCRCWRPASARTRAARPSCNDLAVDLTRIMLISPVLFAVSGMFMGILNARRHFLTPALAPMFYNLSIIVAALVSDDVRVLAVGVVAGAALHLAVQLPDLRYAGMAYRLVADWTRRRGARGRRADGAAHARPGRDPDQLLLRRASSSPRTLSAGAISAVSFAWLIS